MDPEHTHSAHDPDVEELLRELHELEAEEREVSATRRRLHERLDAFPNDVNAKRERELSDHRHQLHKRITELRATLGPILSARRG